MISLNGIKCVYFFLCSSLFDFPLFTFFFCYQLICIFFYFLCKQTYEQINVNFFNIRDTHTTNHAVKKDIEMLKTADAGLLGLITIKSELLGKSKIRTNKGLLNETLIAASVAIISICTCNVFL